MVENTEEFKQSRNDLKIYAKSYILKKKKLNVDLEQQNSVARYVIYARKSTEDDKRQVQSIEDQIDHCTRFAKANNLHVIDIVREEKSAKIAGKRKRFSEMLRAIKNKEGYDSILAWHPDRLARNMKESGEILDMLDNGVIKDLKFTSYTFNNDTAGKMTLSILFAMAKEFSDKLSDDTKRGISKKVSEGKFCGANKRGYVKSSSEYYRKDPDSFELYASTWKTYLSGKSSQSSLIEDLKKQGVKNINKNTLSNMFQDPFYAGIYCFGGQVVDLTEVDPKFPVMVGASDFLTVQRMSLEVPRGWRKTNEFRPFNDLVICGDCGKLMTSGLSSGHKEKYLSVTCGNSKCRAKRKELGILPIANTIRGKIIIETTVKFLSEQLKVNRVSYEKAKMEYLKSRDWTLRELVEKIKAVRIAVTTLQRKISNISDLLVEDSGDLTLKDRWKSDIKKLSLQEKEQLKKLDYLQNSKAEIERQVIEDFPSYDQFVNFFKNAVNVVQKTDDAQLIDKIVKMVFVNLVAKDKSIVRMDVQEPFRSYSKLKNTFGVADGI